MKRPSRSRVIAIILLVLCATLLALPARAQYTQQGPKLGAPVVAVNASHGHSVAISADGNTAIVGARGDFPDGAAWIWTRDSAGGWTPAAKLVGSGGAYSYQGDSVAISADGNTAAVGAPLDTSLHGAVWIFTRTSGIWTQQGSKLSATKATASARQGSSVALAADGNTLIVGAPDDNSDAGSAWIWTRSDGRWTQQGGSLVGSGAVGPAQQGASVALAADGSTAIVGGFWDDEGRGAAWIWSRSGGIWSQQGSKLVVPGAAAQAFEGYSVALSGDGNTAIVGRGEYGGGPSIWSRSAGTWTRGATLFGSGTTGRVSRQGFSVSLSADGNRALVGDVADNNGTGAARVWARTAGGWTQLGSKLVGSSALDLTEQGFSCALSGDGKTAIVGGPGDHAFAGAAWIFFDTGAPVITTHPSSPTLTAGATATFLAGAVGIPAPSVQWQISTNGGSTFSDIAGATSTTYSFSAALSNNANRYRAVFTNSAGSATTNDALLTVNVRPAVTTHPASQSVGAGSTAMFTAAATGTPTPPVQWQVSTDSGSTWSDIAAATSPTLSFLAVFGDNDKQYRAVFTNAAGSASTNAARLTVTRPAVSVDRTSLGFAAVTNGSSFSSNTPPQTIRLSQTAGLKISWAAASNVPWLVVSPTSGTGDATLTVSVRFAPGLAASQTGRIALTLNGASNTAGPITVTLTTVSSTDPASPPFGSFDTQAGDGTALAGSVAMTGWALDNIGVNRVELWRDVVAGESTPPFTSTATDPRNGKIFVSNATFVEGARPDVEPLYSTLPFGSRAGWGYLLLTWGLPNQGNGTYQFYAYAFDEENNVSTLGTKIILVTNNTATKPFGSIDTPAIGGDASGPNYGWALTPKVNGAATCRILPSGVQVSIDSGPLQPVVYGDVRSDVAGAFAGFSNSAAAGGHDIFDWSALTNGAHTIAWLVTDDCNRADGIGSRVFNVSGGASRSSHARRLGCRLCEPARRRAMRPSPSPRVSASCPSSRPPVKRAAEPSK
jgi:hypothetical protein